MLTSRLIPVLKPYILGEEPEEEAPVLTYGFCKTSKSSDHVLTLRPQIDIPGLLNGDYLVVWLYCGTALENKFVFTPMTDWLILSGTSRRVYSSIANYVAFGKFYAEEETSYTFNHEWWQNTTICMQVYAYRNISRRYPVDQNFGVGIANADTGYQNEHRIFWDQQRRIHSASAYVAHALLYRSTITTPAITYNSETYIGGNEFLADTVKTGFASNMHLDTYSEKASRHSLVNMIPSNSLQGGEIGDGPFASINLEVASRSSGALRSKYLRIVGEDEEAHHYLGAIVVNMTAGQKGYFIAKLGAETTVSSDYVWTVTVKNPSGSFVGFQTASGQGGTFKTTSPSPVIPGDWWFGQGAYYSGLPSYKAALYGFCFTASESGGHEFRLYPMLETKTSLVYNPGTADTYDTDCAFFGAFFALDRMPDLIETGAPIINGDMNGLIPRAFWRCDPDTRAYFADTYNAGFVLNSKEASFLAPTLIMANDASIWPLMDTPVQISGTVQPYDHLEESGGLYVYADRILAPSYKLEEDDADLPGFYYWEVTIGNYVSDNRNRIGFASESSLKVEYDTTHIYPAGIGIYCRADGKIYTANISGTHSELTAVSPQSAWEAGDVFGFALDIPNKTCYLYRNGVLAWSGLISSQEVHTDKILYRAYGGLAEEAISSGLSSIGFNFTGPFSYTKPSGAVAYDPFNAAG